MKIERMQGNAIVWGGKKLSGDSLSTGLALRVHQGKRKISLQALLSVAKS